jgi:hypothetical protein
MCQTCKDIPKTVKLLVQKSKVQEKEICDLKNENATLTQLINEHRAQIEDLKKPTCLHRHAGEEQKEESTKASTNTCATLLIGDSVIKDISEAGLEQTTVNCMRGAKIGDIASEIKNPERYEAVIIHSGTNDCTDDQDMEPAKTEFEAMVNYIRKEAPTTNIFISTICPRTDEEGKHQSRVDNMNAHFKEIANNTELCEVIDNDSNFKMKNNEADENALNGSKLHLSKSGTKKLLRNMNAKNYGFTSRA